MRQDLKAGDILRTNSRGTLAIVFADRTQIRLGRHSVMRVNAVSRGAPSSLTLERGRAWGRTPRGGGSNLSIETPAATAGIRGTEWAITADDQTTSLQVFSGEVELFNDLGNISVGAGEAATAIFGRAPTRVALVNPVGREQMMYFVALEDGLDLFAGADVPGIALARRGEWEAARAAFANVGSEGRRGSIAAFGTFIADIRLGNDREMPAIDPADPVSYIARSYVESFVGELDASIATANDGLARYPDELALYAVKARAALLQGDAELAREAVGQALARAPNDAAALALNAEIRARYAGEPYAALDEARRAVAANPERIGSYGVLADIRLERGADYEAARVLERAIARDPDNAALHARYAEVMLRQENVEGASAAIERALSIDPSLAIVRVTLAEYHLKLNDPEAAFEAALAASADHPAYSRALIVLAQIYHRLGDDVSAEQQLDAADRLDPNSPLVPLARTAIALDRYAADDAIMAAREAVRRFQARGGVYSSLSENRETGSYVSQAFRFLDLEEWGRYYGDRVFDSFTPSSFFDQALNRPGQPFTVDSEPEFRTGGAGEDFEDLSSFLQGMVLDPLSVTGPDRYLQFSNERFLETEPFVEARDSDTPFEMTYGVELEGLVFDPLPMGFALLADRSTSFDNRIGDVDDQTFGAFAGFEPTPNDRVALIGLLGSESLDENRELGAGATFDREFDEDTNLFIGAYSHRFAARSEFTLFGGHVDISTIRDTRLGGDEPGIGRLILREIGEQDVEARFGGVSYTHSFGRIDLEAGGETIKYDFVSSGAQTVIFETGETVVINESAISFSAEQQRLYVDLRASPRGPFTVQAQAAIVSSDVIAPGLLEENEDRFDFRIGTALEPAAGHWLRAAVSRQSGSAFPFTFAPVTAIGLRENIVPVNFGVQFETLMARWDGEWDDRLFTAVEYQRQTFDSLSIDSPDDVNSFEIDNARISQLVVAANLWVSGNVGLHANYAWNDGSVRGEPAMRIPFLPEHRASSGIRWTHSSRLALQLNLSYTGEQFADPDGTPIADFVTADAEIRFEPFDRRAELRLALINIFDRRFDLGNGTESRGIGMLASARYRF